jgi:hypothetical protein
MYSVLSEEAVPVPLNTSVCARFGVTTIIPGAAPAVIGATFPRMSFCASTIYKPADALPALTLFEINARYLMPLVCELLEGVAPQLRSIKLAASEITRRNKGFFKAGTPTSCRITANNQLDARQGL